MRYLILAALFAAFPASAETLVLTQLRGYQPPASADVVKVLRAGGSVWAPVATVKPTESIQVCVDGGVAIGSTTSCPTRVQGRTDNWQVKALAIPPIPVRLGTVTFRWQPVTQDTDGAPIAIEGYTVIIRRQNCTVGTDAGCDVAASEAPLELGNVLTYTVPDVALEACAYIQARTPAKDLGLLPPVACHLAVPPRQIPAMVTGITVESP